MADRNFDVHDHASGRAQSYALSTVLEHTVGKAIESVGNGLDVHPHRIRFISMSVTNGLQAGIDSALSYHAKGRKFEHWDLALNFLVKQLQDLVKDELDPHRDHFLLPNAPEDEREEEWSRLTGTVLSEAIALLKTIYAPRPQKRPGY
jgi:hypothetical protein